MIRQTENDMGRVVVEVILANNRDVLRAEAGEIPFDAIQRVTIQGVIDTGATRLVLPQSVVDQLGFPQVSEATVRYAERQSAPSSRMCGWN